MEMHARTVQQQMRRRRRHPDASRCRRGRHATRAHTLWSSELVRALFSDAWIAVAGLDRRRPIVHMVHMDGDGDTTHGSAGAAGEQRLRVSL